MALAFLHLTSPLALSTLLSVLLCPCSSYCLANINMGLIFTQTRFFSMQGKGKKNIHGIFWQRLAGLHNIRPCSSNLQWSFMKNYDAKWSTLTVYILLCRLKWEFLKTLNTEYLWIPCLQVTAMMDELLISYCYVITRLFWQVARLLVGHNQGCIYLIIKKERKRKQ